MKAVIHLAVFLLFAVVACNFAFAQDTVYVIQVYAPAPEAYTQPVAEADAPIAVTQKNKERHRSSFYLNSSIGFDYSYIYYDHRYYDEKTEFDGSAVGFISELTMGILIREFIAIHGTVEFSQFDGDYDLIRHKEPEKWGNDVNYSDNDYFWNSDIDGDLLLFGPGITIFPFSRKESVMHGAYIDTKLLMGVLAVKDPLDSYDFIRDKRDDYFAFAWDFEIGKDWPVSERTYIGIGIKWQLLAVGSGDDMAGEEDYDNYYHHTHMMNSLQLLLRVNRK